MKTLFSFLFIALSLVSNCQCQGDFDGSGHISASDVSQFLGAFGKPCDSLFCHGDFNQDGFVNVNDLTPFLSVFGTYCEEPLSLEPLIWWYYQDGPLPGITLNDLHSVHGDFEMFDSIVQSDTDSIKFEYIFEENVFFSGYDEDALSLNLGQIAEEVGCNEFIDITIRLTHNGYIYTREINFFLVMHFAFSDGDECEDDGSSFTWDLFGPREEFEFCLNCGN